MKFKYLLLSIVLVLSLHSCGGDDDVVPVEQEVTDPTDPGNGDPNDPTDPGDGNGSSGGGGGASIMITCDGSGFQVEVLDRAFNLSWNPCTTSDGSEVNYNIVVSSEYWDCSWGGYLFNEQFFNTSDTSITINNLNYFTKYYINIFAIDIENNSIRIGEPGTSYAAMLSGTIQGNITLHSQKQVDSFLDAGITEITGDLILGERICFGWAEGNPGIGSLESLEGLERIGGDFIINGSFCTFNSLNGLQSLTSIGGDLGLGSLESVENLDELTTLQTVSGNVTIGVSSLASIDGLESLTTIGGDLNIGGLNLNTFPSFENLTQLNNLTLNLPDISEIDAFNNVSNTIGDVIVDTGAQSINILNNVSTVENVEISGPNLTNILAFNNASDINNLTLQDIPSITDIDAFNNISNSVGDVIINTGAQNINVLNNVTTAGNFSAGGSNLLELVALTNATSSGNFSVNGADQLTALTNATTTGDIQIFNVQTLNGFESIETVGLLSLDDVNTSNINTFEQLHVVDELFISGAMFNVNSFLDNINEISSEININFTSGIQHLDFNAISSSSALDVNFRNNSDLEAITGLNNTMSIADCYISANPQLMNIDFLSSVTEVTESSLEILDNDQLTNLDALSNLNYIECPGILEVSGNFNLGDLCGLQNLFVNNGLCSFNATIENNGYNPTPLQIANGDCML